MSHIVILKALDRRCDNHFHCGRIQSVFCGNLYDAIIRVAQGLFLNVNHIRANSHRSVNGEKCGVRNEVTACRAAGQSTVPFGFTRIYVG